MGLANAAWAGLLALAALPILVHLLFRRRTRTIRFPSLRLLRTVDPHLARRRRLHEILLLALRSAAILLAVLAFLRPWAGASAAGSSSADRVVLLDDSASTALGGESPAFAEAVATARGVFRRMRPGDRAALHLVVAGPLAPPEGLTQDARACLRALDGLERTDGRGSLAAAVRRAGLALAKGTSPDRGLVIVSDLEAGTFGEADLAAAVRTLEGGVRVVVARVARPAAVRDAAVVRLATGPGPCVVGRPFRVRVFVERRAGPAVPVRVHLAAGGGVPETKESTASGSGAAEVAFDVTPSAAGPLALVASVDPDDFPPNDRRHLVVEARARVSVALVDGDLDDPAAPAGLTGGALVALALDPPGDGSLTGILVRRRGALDTDLAAIRAADVLVVHDAPDLPEALAAAILARHLEGAGLLVVAGRRAARANHAVPDLLEGAVPARTLTPPGDGDPTALTVTAPDDPWVAGLAPAGGRARLEGVTVKGVLATAPHSDATTLLDARGRPVLLRGPGRPAPSLLFAAPLDPTATTFGLRPSFLAWLHAVVPALACGGVEHAVVVAGETGGPRVVPRAGILDLDRGAAAFAVNADPAEADPARLDAEAARARLGGLAVVVPAGAVAEALEAGTRTDLTGLFLVLASAALLAETVLANAPRRRLSAATHAALARPAGSEKAVA